MSAFAYTDIEKVNSAGVLAFEASGLVKILETSLAAASADVANEALTLVKSLAEGVDQWIEPYLVEVLPLVLNNLASPKTAVAAEEAGNAILHTSNSHSVKIITATLYELFTSMKWQTKKGALVLFGDLAQHHPIVVQRNLPEIINRLILMASDVKEEEEVKEQIHVAFGKITATITNVDIIPIIPRVVAAYMDPAKLTKTAINALVSTTFINEVDLPTLGLLVPVLTRGMRERLAATKRAAAEVIGNMCKLVNDPRAAAEFYPILKPVLERGIEEIGEEEVRKVCEHSLETLLRVAGDAQVLSDAVFTHADLVNSINKSLTKNGVADAAQFAKLVDFAAKGAHFLVKSNDRDKDEWLATLVPYLKAILSSEEKVTTVAEEVIVEGTAALSAEKADFLVGRGKILVNATITVGDNSRVLLHRATVKVEAGRRYGIIGPKRDDLSTLLQAIASGRLPEFPTDLVMIYVGEDSSDLVADQTVLESASATGASEEKVRAVLTGMGFGMSRTAAAIEAGVGTLSGGWRKRLALSRALLLHPDMLLLDEPTNHLDQFAVEWLTDYVKNLKTCTCLLVSHDTKFLDAVCTNIMHYENLKLKRYMGNLSTFMKKKPKALLDTKHTVLPRSNNQTKVVRYLSKKGHDSSANESDPKRSKVHAMIDDAGNTDSIVYALSGSDGERIFGSSSLEYKKADAGEALKLSPEETLESLDYMVRTHLGGDYSKLEWLRIAHTEKAYPTAFSEWTKAEETYQKVMYITSQASTKANIFRYHAIAHVGDSLRKLERLSAKLDQDGQNSKTKQSIHVEKQKLKDKVGHVDVSITLHSDTYLMLQTLLLNEDVGQTNTIKAVLSQIQSQQAAAVAAEQVAKTAADEAMELRDLWLQNMESTQQHKDAQAEKEAQWVRDETAANETAYLEMRSLMPIDICTLSVAELRRRFTQNGGWISRELAQDLKSNMILHWIVMDKDAIRRDAFLMGMKKTCFEKYNRLDLRELRGLSSRLPATFDHDSTKAKQAWKTGVLDLVQRLVSRQRGDTVLTYDHVADRRMPSSQPALSSQEIRRGIYFHPTYEAMHEQLKLSKNRVDSLAALESALEELSKKVAEDKLEMSVTAQEVRNPSLIEQFTLSVLENCRDKARAAHDSSAAEKKALEAQIGTTRSAVEAQLSPDEVQADMEALAAHLALRGVQWAQEGLPPQEVLGVFDPHLPLPVIIVETAKYDGVEKEAARRKAEVAMLATSAKIAAQDDAFQEENGGANGSSFATCAGSAEVPCTPGVEGAVSATAPNTEFKKLPAAALSIFSPAAARTQSSVAAFETPRRRNSVLLNANPDMLNTLNKMLMNSPAATPLKNARRSLFTDASASKFAVKNSAAAADDKEDAPVVKAVTRSKTLLKMLAPSLAAGSSNLSPKRSAPMPKLNFLAQLTGRTNGLKPSNANDAGEDASSGPAAPSAAPGGPSRGAMSLFADITRFRKPDAEEVAVSGSGAAAESDNSKENGAPGNIDESSEAPPATDYKKANPSSSIDPAAGPAAAMRMPMMSMLDQIRQRRLIE